MYVEIAKICPSMKFFDVGGGLAVDYDGTKSSKPTSMNYTEEEYARDIVYSLKEICNEEQVAYPDILSESGRATVAHHAMLVVEVSDVASALSPVPFAEDPPSDHWLLSDLQNMYNNLDENNFRETLNDSLSLKFETLEEFIRGDLTLEERSYAEMLLRRLKSKLYSVGIKLPRYPEEIDTFEKELLDVYFCNFSVFQSIPDFWAIGQLFPIMPLQRLDLEPNRRAIIADLTCDSDGKIDAFIAKDDTSPSLLLHEISHNESYYIGIFLVGAYQEILGDLHNLFGDTNAVHVALDENGKPNFTHVVQGDSIKEVLEYVEFDPNDLTERLRNAIEVGLRNGTPEEKDARFLRQRYKEALDGYTYLIKFDLENGQGASGK